MITLEYYTLRMELQMEGTRVYLLMDFNPSSKKSLVGPPDRFTQKYSLGYPLILD